MDVGHVAAHAHESPLARGGDGAPRRWTARTVRPTDARLTRIRGAPYRPADHAGRPTAAADRRSAAPGGGARLRPGVLERSAAARVEQMRSIVRALDGHGRRRACGRRDRHRGPRPRRSGPPWLPGPATTWRDAVTGRRPVADPEAIAVGAPLRLARWPTIPVSEDRGALPEVAASRPAEASATIRSEAPSRPSIVNARSPLVALVGLPWWCPPWTRAGPPSPRRRRPAPGGWARAGRPCRGWSGPPADRRSSTWPYGSAIAPRSSTSVPRAGATDRRRASRGARPSHRRSRTAEACRAGRPRRSRRRGP